MRRIREEKGKRLRQSEKGLERKKEGEPRQRDKGYRVQRQGIMKGSIAEMGERRKWHVVLHTHKQRGVKEMVEWFANILETWYFHDTSFMHMLSTLFKHDSYYKRTTPSDEHFAQTSSKGFID